MYNTRYTPFDHYPKFLNFSEIQDPLVPLNLFFAADDVKGHKAHLKSWRFYVINKDCYQGDRWGPGQLLYEHELNMKLMEASYILLLSSYESRKRLRDANETQLKEEKRDWTYFPKRLPNKYLTDPYVALDKVFKKIKPQIFRDCLNMWLSDALHNKPTDEVTPPSEIINIYDSLKLLYDATWLIYQRESDEPHLKDNYGSMAKMEKIAKRMILKEQFPAAGESDKLVIDKLVSFISERFTTIDMICYLGKNDDPKIFYLVLVRNVEDTSDDGELGNKIEDHCKHLADVHAIVHRFDAVVKGLEDGARFWTILISKGEVLYQRNPNILLPAPQQISNATLIERAKSKWKRWGIQGDLYVSGAEHLISNKREINKEDYIQASAMLNYATRNYLKAVIESVIGYRVQAHNLSRLIKLTLLLTDEVRAVFKLETEKGIQLYTFIKEAGQKASYFENYNPDESSVKDGLKLIKQFALVTEAVKHRFIKNWE